MRAGTFLHCSSTHSQHLEWSLTHSRHAKFVDLVNRLYLCVPSFGELGKSRCTIIKVGRPDRVYVIFGNFVEIIAKSWFSSKYQQCYYSYEKMMYKHKFNSAINYWAITFHFHILEICSDLLLRTVISPALIPFLLITPQPTAIYYLLPTLLWPRWPRPSSCQAQLTLDISMAFNIGNLSYSLWASAALTLPFWLQLCQFFSTWRLLFCSLPISPIWSMFTCCNGFK